MIIPPYSMITFRKGMSAGIMGLIVLLSNFFAVIVTHKVHRDDNKDHIRSKPSNITKLEKINFSQIPDCDIECISSSPQPKNICDVVIHLQYYCINKTSVEGVTCSIECPKNTTSDYCAYVMLLQRYCESVKNTTLQARTKSAVSRSVNYFTIDNPEKSIECSRRVRCTKTGCCSTPNCMDMATEMCEVMDFTAEPCQDFHEFTCGGLPADFNIADIISDQIHKLMSERRNSYVFLEAIDSMKNFYKSCLDEDSIRSGSLEYIQRLIYSLGGWGVLQNTSYSDKFSAFNWNTYVHHWLKYGIYPDDLLYFDFEDATGTDEKPNITTLPPRLSLPVDILLEGKYNEKVNAYFQFMRDVALLLGADPKVVDEEMGEILNLEINLAHAKAEFETGDTDDTSFSEESVADMTRRFPAINWWAFLINFCHNTKQNDCYIKYYGAFKMKKLVDVISQASERLLNNYVVWKAIAKVGIFSSPQINEIFHKHFSNSSITFAGTYVDRKCIKSKGRWMCNCIETTKRMFSKALNYLYANRYFDEISNKAVITISDRIKEYYVSQIARWKTNKEKGEEEVKEYVQTALSSLTDCFYHDLLNIDELRLYYSNVPVVNSTNFLYWFQSMNLFHATKYVEQYKNDTSTNRTTSTCKGQFYIDSSIGGYHGAYLPWEKTSFVGLRIIQSTQFDPYLPEYINLAKIGFYIARLMALVIFKADPSDEYVSIRENATLSDMNIVMKNDICVKKQLSELSFEIENEKLINSRATMEVILDDIAFTAAYDTYIATSKTKKFEKLSLGVPGFENYTTNEVFWMNYGMSTCQLRDENVISRVRVLMTAMKHDEFRTDFVCSKSSKMSTQIECPDLWSLLKEEDK